MCNGFLTLMDWDLDTDTDLDSSPVATLYYTEDVHIAWTRTQIPTPYFCIVQESESESVPVSESDNVIKP